MSKIIAAINMTLDGYCDHTAVIPDPGLHWHYTDLLSNSGGILYGRITYQLMEYWKAFLGKPSGNESMDEFARVIDEIPKIVFSRTLQDPDWETARLAERELEAEVSELKLQEGGDILVGSRSLIIQLLKLKLIDEFQLCIHPVVAGKGLPLFEDMQERAEFKLAKSKVLGSGASVLYLVKPE